MERLSAGDLRTVLEVAHELGAVDGDAAFRSSLLPQLRRLVPYDSASLNEISMRERRARITAVDPLDSREDGAEQKFAVYAHQNPLVAAAEPEQVLKFSDFVTARQLHRLDIYDAIYAPQEVEHQMAFLLGAPVAVLAGVALNRSRLDFSERDRSVLDAVRPFVSQVHQRLAAQALADATLAAIDGAGDSTGRPFLITGPDGRIEHASGGALSLLQGIGTAGRRDLLPEPLASWRDAQRGLMRSTPLVLQTAEGRFRAWLIVDGGRFDTILFESARCPTRPLGLTARETEVVELVVEGLSNAQIALELGVSERTVAKHLEHTYAKLGVASRMAAAVRMRELA